MNKKPYECSPLNVKLISLSYLSLLSSNHILESRIRKRDFFIMFKVKDKQVQKMTL